jgi:hypothetical protein
MNNAVRSCPASFVPSSDIAHAMKLIIDVGKPIPMKIWTMDIEI